jgi:hypothetical protein
MKKTASSKPAAKKPTKTERIKGRIDKLEATIEKYESRRTKRQEKLAALKTLLASLSKKS